MMKLRTKLPGIQTLLPVLVGLLTLVAFSSLLLAQTTQPAATADPTDPTDPTDNMVIRLPDGRQMTIADLQNQGGGAIVMSRGDGNGTTTHIVDEDGRKITITETDDEIVIKVKDGDAEPVEYRAANEDELKQNHPDGYAIYEKHSHKDLMAGLGGGPGGPGGGAAGIGDKIMIRSTMPMGGASKKIDSLGLGLTNVHDDFVKSQLGDGAVVMRVKKDSRADKLGLKKFDLIKSINGQVVESTDDVDDSAGDKEKLSIEVVRGGKSVKLEEK